MDPLISLEATEYITDLYMIMKDSCQCKPQIVDMLIGIIESGKKWANVRSVMFIGLGFVRYGNTVGYNPAEDDDAEKAAEIFAEVFPNITSVAYSRDGYDTRTTGLNYNNSTPLFPIYEMLVRHYRKRLSFIQGLYPLLPSVISSVATETTDLTLSSIYLEQYAEKHGVHPLLEPSVLRRFTLNNIISGINWSWFKPTKDNEIVFSSLERANIIFAERAHRTVKLDPTGGFILRFPALYFLMACDSAPHYGDFYTLFHQSPIAILALGESVKDLPLIDTRIATNAQMLDIIARPNADAPTHLSPGIVTRFYNAMHKVQDLYMVGNTFPLTAIGQLAGVLKMTIELDEDQFSQLHGAIRQLSRLKSLDIAYRRLRRDGKLAYNWGSTEERPVIEPIVPHNNGFRNDALDNWDLQPISTRLHTLKIEHDSVPALYETCRLIRSLPNLNKVAVARETVLNIRALNDIRGKGVKTVMYSP
ncbi:hypothetical protein FBU59_003571 [Linderina macrospora]|uniref:Uncharacterized protein n=1 Tax=Linderina macrospora TaxID=4868 RepID=A0ACC1J895_9FUNG|nr:hypothetical protein FBU59_003571 [Linderina macrospora]